MPPRLPQFRQLIRSKLNAERAFSLVEVVLAVGIISFSMISVLGVLPVGMSAMRQANDETTQSQIIKQLSSRILLTKFTDLNSQFGGKDFFFDESGAAQTADDSNTRYRLNTSITAPIYPGSDKAPASGQAALSSQFTLVKVKLVTSATKNAVTKDTRNLTVAVANLGG